eukprot:3772797-Pyramimonas_sp.AAC.1
MRSTIAVFTIAYGWVLRQANLRDGAFVQRRISGEIVFFLPRSRADLSRRNSPTRIQPYCERREGDETNEWD